MHQTLSSNELHKIWMSCLQISQFEFLLLGTCWGICAWCKICGCWCVVCLRVEDPWNCNPGSNWAVVRKETSENKKFTEKVNIILFGFWRYTHLMFYYVYLCFWCILWLCRYRYCIYLWWLVWWTSAFLFWLAKCQKSWLQLLPASWRGHAP